MTNHYTEIRGDLELVNPPSGLAISLAQALRQCRDPVGADAELTELIQAAAAYVEAEVYGNRQLLQATYDLPLSTWWDARLQLPRPPLRSVASISYYDEDGAQQTLGTTQYAVKTPYHQPGEITWAPESTAPSLEDDRAWPVTVRFVAGYADAASIPPLAQQAMKLLVGHWFDNREAVGEPLEAADRLLALLGWGSYK